jgi:formamidopyrimidine-DNA glycosylase
MPELPEVETIKRQLSPTLINKRILAFFSSGKRLRREIPDLSILIGDKIINVYRRNKYLVLEGLKFWIVIHLGMTGKLIVENNKNIKKHTHFILFLSDDIYLSYEDARRFGSLDIFKKVDFPKYREIPLFLKLGIEPLEKEFTLQKVRELFNSSSLQVKKYLMDSNNICGVGNIYANEVLFICGINPQKISKNLTDREIKLLFKTITSVLLKAISLGGSSISDFVHTNGTRGTMQENYFVYAREGQPCKKCETSILKITQGGRSSFYCPHCQALN